MKPHLKLRLEKRFYQIGFEVQQGDFGTFETIQLMLDRHDGKLLLVKNDDTGKMAAINPPDFHRWKKICEIE